jgi:hypothetical protein
MINWLIWKRNFKYFEKPSNDFELNFSDAVYNLTAMLRLRFISGCSFFASFNICQTKNIDTIQSLSKRVRAEAVSLLIGTVFQSVCHQTEIDFNFVTKVQIFYLANSFDKNEIFDSIQNFLKLQMGISNCIPIQIIPVSLLIDSNTLCSVTLSAINDLQVATQLWFP